MLIKCRISINLHRVLIPVIYLLEVGCKINVWLYCWNRKLTKIQIKWYTASIYIKPFYIKFIWRKFFCTPREKSTYEVFWGIKFLIHEVVQNMTISLMCTCILKQCANAFWRAVSILKEESERNLSSNILWFLWNFYTFFFCVCVWLCKFAQSIKTI